MNKRIEQMTQLLKQLAHELNAMDDETRHELVLEFLHAAYPREFGAAEIQRGSEKLGGVETYIPMERRSATC